MNRLYCGAAKERITPPSELIPYFWGLTLTSFDRVYDDLYVRVVALESGDTRALIVSFDLDKGPCPVEFTKALEDTVGVPKENILYFGIHTHTAPILGYRPFEGRNDVTKKPQEVQAAVHAYEAIVLEHLKAAAVAAVASLKPARVGYATGNSYININRNRRYEALNEGGYYIEQGWGNMGTVADPTAALIRFDDEDGTPIAFFANYAMHNVGMFLNDAGEGHSAISSDIGGTVSKYFEEQYAGSICVWSSGAAGDTNCLMTTTLEYPDPHDGTKRMEPVVPLDVASKHTRMLAGIHYADLLSVNRRITQMDDKASISVATEYSETPYSENALFKKDYDIDPERRYRIRLRLIKIGDIALIGADGELYSAWGRVIREASPADLTIVINHDSSLLMDNPAYVFSDDVILAAQESLGCTLPGWNQFRGIPGTIGPSLTETTHRLFDDICQ